MKDIGPPPWPNGNRMVLVTALRFADGRLNTGIGFPTPATEADLRASGYVPAVLLARALKEIDNLNALLGIRTPTLSPPTQAPT